MHNTCLTSAISLRTRGTFSFSVNDYGQCSIERNPCAYSSSAAYCCCCANSVYKLPIGSSYCYNLYGLRQSSLIHWSPYRKLISGGVDRFYSSRLPFRDVDFSCSCDNVLSSRQIRRVGGRKGGFRKCMVFEERSERCDIGDDDEAELLLSLLTEDVSEECLLDTKVTSRLVKKPVVEERESGEFSRKCRSKKQGVHHGVLESEPRYGRGSMVVSSRKKDNTRREEVILREEENEGLLRQRNRKARLKEARADALLTNRTAREKSVAFLKKRSQADNENEERKSKLREEENWKVTSRTEERDEHEQTVRKEGSSCSSYYSFSSTGDFESEAGVELREGLSRSEKRDSKSNAIVNQEVRNGEELIQEDYRENHGVISTKKNAQSVHMVGSSVVESSFRKKSEKRLSDVQLLELDLREEASQKESKLFMGRERNYNNSSDYYVSYDDRQENTNFDEGRSQQHRQTRNEVSRQSETRMKHKEFVEMQESRDDHIINSYVSQNLYSGKGEISDKVASSSHETVGDHQRVVELGTREDDYERNSVQVAKVSEVQDIDIRKTSISQQKFETSVKEDYSTNIHSSINVAAKQKQDDQVSALVESRGRTQQLTKKEGKSILKKVSDARTRQEKNMNLTSGSYSESRIVKRDDSGKGYDELPQTSLAHTGDSAAVNIEGRNKTKSERESGTPSQLQETGASPQTSSVGIDTKISDGSLQVVSTSLHERYGDAESSSTHGQPLKFVSPEDTIGSAALLEKSAEQYVGDFINQVRDEIVSSEIQKERRTEFVHEEQHHKHDLVQYISGDAQSKDNKSRSDSRQSGTKGPSDEIWNVDEPSVQESSRTGDQDDASKAGKGVDKRTGRSLWNIISDIALLRWSTHTENHSSGRKTGGRSSPKQSTSSETWFSGHEAAENEEVTEEKEPKSVTLGLSGSNLEDRSHSRVEEGSSLSTVEGHQKHVGINVPSSSNAPKLPKIRSSLHLGVISEGISTTATTEPSFPLPAARQQRAPAVQGVSEAEEPKASDSGMRQRLNSGLIEKTEAAVDDGELRRHRLQRQDQVIKDRFDEWDNAYRLEAEQRKIDEKFMWEALLEAQNAADNWEVPVGAVLVHNGKIIARGCNMVEQLRDSTAHAEMICIREASNILRTWRLSETTLYVTLEPCPMCAGAILQARIDTIVWGAPNKLLGADGSWIRLLPDQDRGNVLELSDKPPAPVHPFHPKLVVRRGVLASECADAMQQFFKLRRKKDKKPDPTPTPPTGPPISHRPFKFLSKMHDVFNLMFCLH